MKSLLGKSIVVNNVYFDQNEDAFIGMIHYKDNDVKAYIIDEKIKTKTNSNTKIKSDDNELQNDYEGVVVSIFYDPNGSDFIAVVNDDTTNVEYSNVKGFFYSSNSINNISNIKNMKCKCVNEKSCGAILYFIDKKTNERKYVIIKSTNGFYGFPKGHLEYKETEKEAAIREVYEEIELKIEINNDFYESIKYQVNDEPITKEVIFFLSEIEEEQIENIKIQETELSDIKYASIEEAKELLFDDAYSVLSKADKYYKI